MFNNTGQQAARILKIVALFCLPLLGAWSAADVLPAATPVAVKTASPTRTLPAPTTVYRKIPAPEGRSEDGMIRLLFTGQIVPGRCVQAGVDENGGADYIYADIADLLRGADLTIGTVNGSISNVSKPMGCVTWTFILNGTPVQADAIGRAGFDGVSAATNHINNCSATNCGYRPLQETLANLRRVGVEPIGAGENLGEALRPVIFEVRGVRFGIVSLGEIERKAFAAADRPGIGILNEENLRSALAEARRLADVVIFMPHWGPEYSSLPNPNQLRYARLAVESGADLIIGNHTHVIQGMQMMDDVPVFYGLGNFVFDQDWELRLRSSLLVEVTFEGKEYRSHRSIPVVSEKNGRVSLADESQAQEIIMDMEQANRRIEALTRR